MVNRLYAGQVWANRLVENSESNGAAAVHPAAALQLIAMDLLQDARENGITDSNIELWVNESKDSKGLFMGDTSELASQGWTFLTDLF